MIDIQRIRSVAYLCIVTFIAIFVVSPARSDPRSFKCTEQPLPEFTLGLNSNPTQAELANLCACVWSKFPEGGWEREVSIELSKGQDPGWRTRGFAARFGDAMDACGARKL